MKNKIFVGNLSWKATEDSLKPLFEAFGEVVSVKVVTDQYTGRSRGFAFVVMADDDAAAEALRGLNGKSHLDREMRVSLAEERAPREGGNGGGGSREGGRSFSNDRGSGDRGGRGDRGDRFSGPRREQR